MTDIGNCDECRFYEPWGRNKGDGLCRRHAPRPPVVVISDDEWRERTGSGWAETAEQVKEYPHQKGVGWPEVYCEDWCGDFARKPPEEDLDDYTPEAVRAIIES